MKRKQTGIVNQRFAYKHIVQKPNAKISAWIVNILICIFVFQIKRLISSETCATPKLSI